MGVDQNCKDFIKGGVAVPYVPKIQALPGWGGSDPCLDFLEGFVHMHSVHCTGGPKVIIYHQKVIFPHKSVPYSLEYIIQPHLFNIFTLKHDLRTCMGQIAQDASIGGWVEVST